MTDEMTPERLAGIEARANAATVFPGHKVTPEGRVFSVSTNWRSYGERELRQADNAHGYPSVRVIIDGKRRHLLVHKLVAHAFLPPRPSKEHEIRHLDGDRKNNHVTNLAWGTRSENAQDRKVHGTERAAQNGALSAKLNEGDVATIRRRALAGEQISRIAQDYPRVHRTTVGKYARGGGRANGIA